MKKIFLYLLLCFVMVHCKNNNPENKRLDFHIHHAYGWTVYIEKIALLKSEQNDVIDSAVIKSGDDHLLFSIPENEQRPYRIRMKESSFEALFINDSPEVGIEANILKPSEYTVTGSPASVTLKNFLVAQAKLAEQNRTESAEINRLQNTGGSKRVIDSLSKDFDKRLSVFFQRYVDFADSTSSPGLFLAVYKYIDFGRDFAGLKKFVNHAAERFAGHVAINGIKEETLDYLKTFEIEFNVGDKLPVLTLPDIHGYPFSTDMLKGKYVFMDFWSTWCPQCLEYDPVKAKARKMFPDSRFAIVSIALDAEKENWKNYLTAKGYDWPNLVDEKMWDGETSKLYRIDSIPFNFLLGPDGRILSKAIKKDSVISVLSGLIK